MQFWNALHGPRLELKRSFPIHAMENAQILPAPSEAKYFSESLDILAFPQTAFTQLAFGDSRNSQVWLLPGPLSA